MFSLKLAVVLLALFASSGQAMSPPAIRQVRKFASPSVNGETLQVIVQCNSDEEVLSVTCDAYPVDSGVVLNRDFGVCYFRGDTNKDHVYTAVVNCIQKSALTIVQEGLVPSPSKSRTRVPLVV